MENMRGQEMTGRSPVNPGFLCPEVSGSGLFFPSCSDGRAGARVCLQEPFTGWGIPGEAVAKEGGLSRFGNQGGSQGRVVGKNCCNNKLFALKEGKVCSTINGGRGFKGKHMSETHRSSLFERKICLLLILYNISHRD